MTVLHITVVILTHYNINGGFTDARRYLFNNDDGLSFNRHGNVFEG